MTDLLQFLISKNTKIQVDSSPAAWLEFDNQHLRIYEQGYSKDFGILRHLKMFERLAKYILALDGYGWASHSLKTEVRQLLKLEKRII